MAQVRINSSRLKIGLLLLAHFAAGLGLCRAASTYSCPHPVSVGFAALIYAQVTLVGAWGALGRTEPWSRTLVVLATMVYLSFLTTVPAREPFWSGAWRGPFVGFALLTAVIFIVLSVVKLCQRVRVVQSIPSSPNSAGLQFTIRHLFAITTTIAAVLAAGEVLRGFRFSREIQLFLVAVVVGSGLVVTKLAILWATLCAGRPAIRLGFVLPLPVVVGSILAFYFDKQSDWSYVVWPGLFGFQAAIAAGSLLVVRSCGWRIVRATG